MKRVHFIANLLDLDIDIIDKIEEQIINKKPKIRIQSPIISMLNIDKKILDDIYTVCERQSKSLLGRWKQ